MLFKSVTVDMSNTYEFLRNIGSKLNVGSIVEEIDKVNTEIQWIGKQLCPDSTYWRPSGLEGFMVRVDSEDNTIGKIDGYLQAITPILVTPSFFVVFDKNKLPEKGSHVVITSASIRESMQNPGRYYIKCFNWISYETAKDNYVYYTELINRLFTLMRYREFLRAMSNVVKEIDELNIENDEKEIIGKAIAYMVLTNTFKADTIMAYAILQDPRVKFVVLYTDGDFEFTTDNYRIVLTCGSSKVVKAFIEYSVPAVNIKVVPSEAVITVTGVKGIGTKEGTFRFDLPRDNNDKLVISQKIIGELNDFLVRQAEDYPWTLEGAVFLLNRSHSVIYIYVDGSIYNREWVENVFERYFGQKKLKYYETISNVLSFQAVDLLIKTAVQSFFNEFVGCRDTSDLWRWFNESVQESQV